MTETALTVVEQAELELQELLLNDPHLLDMRGGEHLDDGDTGQPPRIKICQDTDPELELTAGQWYNTLTNDTYDSLSFAILQPLGATRCWYFEPYTEGEPPYCASDDGEIPRESTDRRPLQDRQDGPCEGCLKAAWPSDDDPRKRPYCNRQRNFMLAAEEEDGSWTPVHLMLQVSGIDAAKRLTALAKSCGLRNLLVSRSNFVSKDGYKYYVPFFGKGASLTTKERKADLVAIIKMRDEVERLLDTGKMVIHADEENGSGKSVVDDPHAPTTEEKKMPWDDDPDVVPQAEPIPAAQEDQPPMPESPPFDADHTF